MKMTPLMFYGIDKSTGLMKLQSKKKVPAKIPVASPKDDNEDDDVTITNNVPFANSFTSVNSFRYAPKKASKVASSDKFAGEKDDVIVVGDDLEENKVASLSAEK